MTRQEGQGRSRHFQIDGEIVEVPLPVEVTRTVWFPGGETEAGRHYHDPLVIRLLVDEEDLGAGDGLGDEQEQAEPPLRAVRVDAFGARGEVGPIQGGSGKPAELRVEIPGAPDPLAFSRPQRPLTEDDAPWISSSLKPEVLGYIVVSHVAFERRRRHRLSQADTLAAQRQAGSHRARITEADYQLIAETVRNRPADITPATSLQSLPHRKYSRARAYQLLNAAVKLGYLREDEITTRAGKRS